MCVCRPLQIFYPKLCNDFSNLCLQRFVFTAFLFIFVFQKQFLLCGYLQISLLHLYLCPLSSSGEIGAGYRASHLQDSALLSHLLLVSLFINMLFEVKSITPKWSTNRFPTIAIDTSDLITVLLYLSRLSKTTKPPKSLDGFVVSP